MQEAERGLQFSEHPIFERGSPGRTALSIAPLDVPAVDPAILALGGFARKDAAGLTGGERARRGSPLRAPLAVELLDRLPVLSAGILHDEVQPQGQRVVGAPPRVRAAASVCAGRTSDAGALELMVRLERALAEIVGMDAVSLHPAAGAQGELAGLMMIRAYHQEHGRSPKRVLIPDTAHGTNPASCSLNGLVAVPFPGGPDGIVHPEQIAPLLDGETAAIMITNPNTLGALRDAHLSTVAKMVHEKGALVYGDGANLNALMGRSRPGDLGIDIMQFNLHKTFTTPHGGGGPGCGPVAFKKILEPYQPRPTVYALPGVMGCTRSTTTGRRASGVCGASSGTSG